MERKAIEKIHLLSDGEKKEQSQSRLGDNG